MRECVHVFVSMCILYVCVCETERQRDFQRLSNRYRKCFYCLETDRRLEGFQDSHDEDIFLEGVVL